MSLNLQYSGLHTGQIAFEILQIIFNKVSKKKVTGQIVNGAVPE